MSRWLGALLLCLLAPLPAAAQTYAEVLAECMTLFTPMVSMAQAQRFVPQHPLGEEPDVSGNSESCWVEFKEKDWSPKKPGSATPLLQFSLSHGAEQARKYRDVEKMTSQVAKKTYAAIDPAKYPGAVKGYIYTGFGRHVLTLLLEKNTVTVQVLEDYPRETLDPFMALVLEALAKPELRAWRERQ